ncbi:helix-turn-helix transcriptional regulator [Tumebacillus lipolyticus]|uniref:Helix-turn-helix transcriptional regulator n=1 Tax=Tumebacillus lipolyticus TaxID=1280370 RepID=A0ABW4ZYH7_9BACL
MSRADFHHNFNLFFDCLDLGRQKADRTEQMRFHSQIGEGSIHRFVPRNDLDVALSDFTFYRDRTLALSTETAMVELSFCLDGTRGVSVEGAQHVYAPGSCALQFINQTSVRFEFAGNRPLRMLGIAIPVSTFHHFMEGADGTRSVDFSQLLGARSFRILQAPIHLEASIILDRLIRSAQQPNMRNLELECSIFELLSIGFRSFLLDRQSESPKLSKSDLQKIRAARDIIVDRMADPPSLIELSRMIGLNDYKLKIGFKAVYGTTVFSYLRERRLEQALLLLQQGILNVAEISCAVGYSNASYFAEAFRSKYGVNPGKFVRRSSQLLWARETHTEQDHS